jgi:hypothetical protein
MAFLAGCEQYQIPITQEPSGGSAGGSTGLIVTLIPGGEAYVDAGKSRQITALLQNDTANQGVTWVLTGPGTLSNVTTSSVTYTAPTTLNSTAQVIATSVSDPTQVANCTLYVVPPPTITAATLTNAAVGTPYVGVVQVTGGSNPYNWSVSAGELPPGLALFQESLSSINLSGTPTLAGTFNFTLHVLDVCNVASTQAFTLVVGAASSSSNALLGGGVNNAMVNGNYAFRFSGFGPRGFSAEAGSFTADGKGNITAGTLDRNGAAGPQSKVTFAGTYGVGADQLGAMTLGFADGTSNTFALAVSSTGDARFIEFDDTTGAGTRGSGEMRKRDTVVSGGAGSPENSAGSYVLQLTGVDAAGGRLAMAGQFSSDGSGQVIGSELDANDAGTLTTMVPFSGGANILADGSGNAAWNVPGFGTLHLSLYAVSADEVFAVGMDAAAPGIPLVAGSMLRQSGGPFTSTTLGGSAVLQMTGFIPGQGQGVGQATGTVGVLRFDGTGGAEEFALRTSPNETTDLNNSFVLSASSEGRVLLGSTGAGIVYLASPTRGFVLGMDASAEAGTLESQTEIGNEASFNGTLAGAGLQTAGPGPWTSALSINFGGSGTAKFAVVNSGSNGLVADVQPSPVLYQLTESTVLITNPGQEDDNLVGVLFVISPTKSVYVALGLASAYPVIIQK